MEHTIKLELAYSSSDRDIPLIAKSQSQGGRQAERGRKPESQGRCATALIRLSQTVADMILTP